MFLGVYRVAVTKDGRIELPQQFAAALGVHDLVIEPLAQDRDIVILARPGAGDCACGGGCLHVPPPLLAEAGIGDAAEVHGMGEYLIIRAASA